MIKNLIPLATLFLITQISVAQEAHKYFADHQIPERLRRYVGPEISERLRQEVLSQDNSQSIRVGVIDSGFDLHPSVAARYNWRIKDGELIGYGVDHLSGDEFPYHIEVRPDVFAFGSEGVNQLGQIIKPLENPMAHLDEINSEFMDRLVAEIEANPKLKQSIFSKINDQNMSIMGMVGLSQRMEENSRKAPAIAQRLQSDKDFLARVVNSEWGMSPKTGLPQFGDFKFEEVLLVDQNSRDFMDLLTKVFSEVEAEFGFMQKVFNVQKFMNIQRKVDLKNRKTIIDSYEILQAKWFEDKFGYRQIDPIWNTLGHLTKKFTENEIRIVFGDEHTDEFKIKVIVDTYEKSLDAYEKSLNELLEEEVALEPARQIAITLRNFKDKKAEMVKYFKSRNVLEFFQNPLTAKTANGVEELGREVFDTFIANDSAFNSHGTHVSGIIAKTEGLVIEPHKVGLGQRTNSHLYNEAYAEEYLSEVQKWLDDEVVLDAFYTNFKSVLGEAPSFSSKSKRLEAMKPILELMLDSLKANAYGDLAYYRQSQEISNAIKAMGEKRILVANLSLGGFSQRPTEGRVSDMGNMLMTLQREFSKYHRAVAMKQSAGTTFVIAAGNNGAWSDNYSQSTSPSDLSSPFLYESEAKYGRKAINNTIENVLTVAALGPDTQSAAPFTNISLAQSRPMIFAEGEAVLSAVSRTDFQSPLRGNDELLSSVSFAGVDMNVIGVSTEFRHLNSVVASSRRALILEHALNSVLAEAKYNGTSMAAPETARLFAKLLREEMLRLGLTEAELYGHPDFKPIRLIQKFLYEVEETLGMKLIINNIPKITGDNVEDYTSAPKQSFAAKGKAKNNCTALMSKFLNL